MFRKELVNTWYEMNQNDNDDGDEHEEMQDCIYYIMDRLRLNNCLKWILKDRQNVNFFKQIPRLQITFKDNTNNKSVGCPCRTKQFSSFTVNLKSCYKFRYNNNIYPILTLDFPSEQLSELTTYTFVNENMAKQYFGKRISLSYDPKKNEIHEVISEIKRSLKDADPKTTVLIILSQPEYFVKFLDMSGDLWDWRCPFKDMTIWCAIIDTLSVCRFNVNKHFCSIDTKLLIIFISNPSLKAYSLNLDIQHNNPEKVQSKLQEFKEEIVLSTNSIALMHISHFRMNQFFGLDVSVFKQVFPNVYLFTFYGDASFTGNYLREIFIMRRLPFLKMINLSTNILILSQN